MVLQAARAAQELQQLRSPQRVQKTPSQQPLQADQQQQPLLQLQQGATTELGVPAASKAAAACTWQRCWQQ
jgi:hypothetical protein